MEARTATGSTGLAGRPSGLVAGRTSTADFVGRSPAAVAGAILLFSVALLWPTLFTGTALTFYDSFAYVGTSQSAIGELQAMLDRLLAASGGADPAASGGAAQAAGAADDKEAKVLRSLPYVMFVGLTAAIPTKGLLTVWLQSLMVTIFIALLLDREMLARPWALAAAGLGLATLTSLPFYASLLMPDLLAALILLNAMLIVRGVERLTVPEFSVIFLATGFAVASHHGHPPLAMALAGVVVLLLLVRRRLTLPALLLAGGPIAIALVANMTMSAVALDEVSTAPKRFPILLARSLADGPARWYLEEACPEAGYALCDRIDDMPRNVGGILWSKEGIVRTATAEDMDRIRAEEPEILVNAFLAYPLQQSWSLAGNAAQQLVFVGMDDLHWVPLKQGPDGRWWGTIPDSPDRTGMEELEKVQSAVLIAAALYIGWIALRGRLDKGRREADVLLMLLAGLAINAVIFGGLSVPTDRYQGRIIWLAPMLAALFWLARRAHGAIEPPPAEPQAVTA